MYERRFLLKNRWGFLNTHSIFLMSFKLTEVLASFQYILFSFIIKKLSLRCLSFFSSYKRNIDYFKLEFVCTVSIRKYVNG